MTMASSSPNLCNLKREMKAGSSPTKKNNPSSQSLEKAALAFAQQSASSSSCNENYDLVQLGGGKKEGSKKSYEVEKDCVVLERREKQIEYGKNTLAYDKYTDAIPVNARRSHHPRTPKKHIKYSRRQWDGMVKAWKKNIATFDFDSETPLPEGSRKRKNWSSSNSTVSTSQMSRTSSRASSYKSTAAFDWADDVEASFHTPGDTEEESGDNASENGYRSVMEEDGDETLTNNDKTLERTTNNIEFIDDDDMTPLH